MKGGQAANARVHYGRDALRSDFKTLAVLFQKLQLHALYVHLFDASFIHSCHIINSWLTHADRN